LAGLIAVAQEEAPAEKPAAEPAPPPKKKKAPKADSLDALLRKVKGGWKSENVEVQKRENYFKNAKSEQAALLQKAQGTLAAVQRRSEILEKEFDENKLQLTKLEKTLKERLGTMNELFGVVRQVVADTRGQVDMSLISAQYPGRGDSLAPLAEKTELPSVEQLEELWYVLQHEMTESGKVVRFPATVITTEGKEENQEVIRIGVFNAIADNKFFTWDDKLKKLTELGRQPPSRFLSTASDMQEAKSGFVKVAVDPSSGQILSLLVRTPGFKERIEAGGMIGYFIIGLGILALFLALVRFAYLTVVSVKVQKQRTSTSISNQNPLGRVINIYEQNPDADVETLELKLDEAILRESNKLERLLWLVKIVSVVAPLMGLLGTVTGMIRTFQAITLFGTGDPKMMASGISEALVTTMLGLMVAIPLVLSHSALRSMSKRVIDMLEEQSAGVIAKRVEQLR
jgi:biopolymer transport protein ExbB